MNKISLIDTHAHYNSSIMNDLEDKIKVANSNVDVGKIINVGLDNQTSEESVGISLKNSKFYSAIGVHPLYDGEIEKLEDLYYKYDNTKIVAIGETGIDTNGDISIQIEKFLESIALANKLKLPLIIHANTTKSSDLYANELCIQIIKKYKPLYGFIFHCFQPDLEILREIINLGGYISVGANITKPNAKKSLEVVRIIPIEHLIIETDYSFLTDTPNITGKATFNKICELRNTEKYLMMKTLNNNATRLFPKLNDN